MSWPPIPNSGSSIYSVSVPTHRCRLAPYSLSAPYSDAEISKLTSQTQATNALATGIIARPCDRGTYEVLYGWHQQLIWSDLFDGHPITLTVADYDDHEAINIAIRAVYDDASSDVNKMLLAQSLALAKEHFSFSDSQLSEAMGKGFSRSTVTNLLRLNKLNPIVQKAFLEGKIKSSYAKALCSAPLLLQPELLGSILDARMDLPSLQAAIGSASSNNIDRQYVAQGECEIQFESLAHLVSMVETLKLSGQLDSITGTIRLDCERLDLPENFPNILA